MQSGFGFWCEVLMHHLTHRKFIQSLSRRCSPACHYSRKHLPGNANTLDNCYGLFGDGRIAWANILLNLGDTLERAGEFAKNENRWCILSKCLLYTNRETSGHEQQPGTTAKVMDIGKPFLGVRGEFHLAQFCGSFMCMSFRTVSLGHLFQFCLGVCSLGWSCRASY